MSAQIQQSSFNFDAKFSAAARDRGISITILNNKEFIDEARSIARFICRQKGTICMDDVRRVTESRGLEPKTSAAFGAIFRSGEWMFTGEWRNSTYISNHSRVNRVWALKVAI